MTIIWYFKFKQLNTSTVYQKNVQPMQHHCMYSLWMLCSAEAAVCVYQYTSSIQERVLRTCLRSLVLFLPPKKLESILYLSVVGRNIRVFQKSYTFISNSDQRHQLVFFLEQQPSQLFTFSKCNNFKEYIYFLTFNAVMYIQSCYPDWPRIGHLDFHCKSLVLLTSVTTLALYF